MIPQNHPIHWSKDIIYITGSPSPKDIYWAANAYHTIYKQGYPFITLNFMECRAVFESFMLPLVCLAQKYRYEFNVQTTLALPNDPKLKALFHNSNWQHLIEPETYEASTFIQDKHVPTFQFKKGDGQKEVVDKVMNAVLSSLAGLTRHSLKALEWSVNEITDNVLNHAKSNVGGFLQATTFSEKKMVEFVVADAGIGIAKSLGMKGQKEALEAAIKEGVTRDKKTNAGNGLFGSYQIAILSGGEFQIHSYNASLVATHDALSYPDNKRTLYPGTIVIVKIDCSKEDILERALRFNGKPHIPAYDYIDQKYGEEEHTVHFMMKDETHSFGSREAAKPVKVKMENLLRMHPDHKLLIDFAEVFLFSSSFADEVFGRLFSELGATTFMSRIEFTNVDKTVRGLIDRAITQRMILSQQISHDEKL